jgi:acyl-CoA hydrolase
MMQTLSGAAVSDGLEGWRRSCSGRGRPVQLRRHGARALPDGRSVLMLRAARCGKQGEQSNIVWNYGHTTIARTCAISS